MRSVRFPHLPPLDALVAFEAAAEHESFARAGEELFLTASAVAYQVKKLEAMLGFSLFTRHGKGVSLTSQGQELFMQVKTTFGIFQRDVERIRHQQLAPVKLATQHAIAQLWLHRRLGEYQQLHPEHELEITAVSTISGQPEETDLALAYFQHDPGSKWRKLWSETLVPVASPTYQSASPIFFQDMHWHDDWRHWREDKRFSSVDSRLRRASLYTLLLQSVLDGQGAMVGRLSLIEEYIQRGELEFWPDSDINKVESGGYYLYCSPSCREHTVANHFVSWLTDALVSFA